MNDTTTLALKRRFEEVFYRPARPQLTSGRGQSAWLDLMSLEDALAGPIFSVAETGGCAYVYAREDEFFRGVDGPAALRERLRLWHIELVDGIESFVSLSAIEAADLLSMRQFASEVWAIAELACEIEAERYEAKKHSSD